MIVALTIFVLISTVNFMYAQNDIPKDNSASPDNGTDNRKSDWLEILANELITTTAPIVGLGITALVQWLRSRGIPISDEQETMFRNIVTNRYEKLAKDSWKKMRENPEKLSEYWNELRKGHIPAEFQERLKKEGKEFAMDLKQNKEFRDFAKDITESGMEKLLEDLRTNLKNDYQKQMLDVIPKLASTAVDSAFDPKVSDVATWSDNALKNLKPLLLSSEAIDTENNLLIIIQSEINKRLQERLVVK